MINGGKVEVRFFNILAILTGGTLLQGTGEGQTPLGNIQTPNHKGLKEYRTAHHIEGACQLELENQSGVVITGSGEYQLSEGNQHQRQSKNDMQNSGAKQVTAFLHQAEQHPPLQQRSCHQQSHTQNILIQVCRLVLCKAYSQKQRHHHRSQLDELPLHLTTLNRRPAEVSHCNVVWPVNLNRHGEHQPGQSCHDKGRAEIGDTYGMPIPSQQGQAGKAHQNR